MDGCHQRNYPTFRLALVSGVIGNLSASTIETRLMWSKFVRKVKKQKIEITCIYLPKRRMRKKSSKCTN